MQATNFWNLYHLSSKKIICFFATCLFFMQVDAQVNILKHDNRNEIRKYGYGIHLAFNQHNFRVNHAPQFMRQSELLGIEGKNNLGIEVGIIGKLFPTKNLEVRAIPSIAFGDRNVVFYEKGKEEATVFKGESTIFDIPLLLKYKSEPYQDFRLFGIGGVKLRSNLNAKGPSADPTEDIVLFNKSDLQVEIGAGAEFHFELFTLAPEFKISHSLRNQNNQSAESFYSNSINGLHSRLYTISINIE